MRPGPRQPTRDEFLIKSCHSLIFAFRAGGSGIPVGSGRQARLGIQSLHEGIVNCCVQPGMIGHRSAMNGLQQAEGTVHRGIAGGIQSLRPVRSGPFSLSFRDIVGLSHRTSLMSSPFQLRRLGHSGVRDRSPPRGTRRPPRVEVILVPRERDLAVLGNC